MMEGARRIEEWEKVVQLLPDDRVVFRVVSTPKDDKITLSADEWKVLFLVNGQRTLAELVAEAEDDALNVYRIIYGLQANRLIEAIRPPHSNRRYEPADGRETCRDGRRRHDEAERRLRFRRNDARRQATTRACSCPARRSCHGATSSSRSSRNCRSATAKRASRIVR